jgi:hypothetical protein
VVRGGAWTIADGTTITDPVTAVGVAAGAIVTAAAGGA